MLYHVNLGFVAATQIEIIGSYFHSTGIGLVVLDSWTSHLLFKNPSQTGSIVFHFGIFLCEILYVDESKNSGPKKPFSTQKQEIHN